MSWVRVRDRLSLINQSDFEISADFGASTALVIWRRASLLLLHGRSLESEQDEEIGTVHSMY